jgi:ribosomal protein S18 acetylase RimI-like enzyme
MKIRQANQSDKSNLIAKLMYNSGKELCDFLHQIEDKNAISYLEYEFKSGKGFGGYNNITIAEIDNELIAIGCFYDGTKFNKLMLGSLANMFKFYGLIKVWPVLKRASHTGSIIIKPKANELYLSGLSVPKTKRGQGNGTALIKNKIASAKATKYKTFSLDVATNNSKAEKLYSKLGFKITEEKVFSGKRVGFDIPNLRKMELTLNS